MLQPHRIRLNRKLSWYLPHEAFRRFMKSNIWLRNIGIGPINFWRQKKCITRHADLKCVLYAHKICFINNKFVWLKVYASLQRGNVFAPVTKVQRRKRLIKFLQICLSFRYGFNPNVWLMFRTCFSFRNAQEPKLIPCPCCKKRPDFRVGWGGFRFGCLDWGRG